MMSAGILSNSNNLGLVGVGNNNQRKSKRELELMKLRRAPICEVIVPPTTSSSSSSSPLLVKSNQADNEETTAVKSNNNNNDLLLQPVHSTTNNSQGSNQPDLVAQSHELSKRRFFEKLQRRESAMHQSACVRPVAVGTIFEQNKRQVHLKEEEEEAIGEAQDSNEHDDGQLRVLPLDCHDHAREIDCVRGEFPSGVNGGANEQIPETIVHLVDEHLNAPHRHKAHEHDATTTMSQKVAPPSSSSSPSSSGASSSSWLIENHGYASLAPALSTTRRPPASAVAYRQYANLPPMINAPAWPRGSTTTSGAPSAASVPVGYATVRPSSTRIPQPTATCAVENKKDLTTSTTTSGASEIDCDSDAAPRRPASNSSTSNSSGGFSSARRFHPAAVRDLIDHNQFANGHQEEHFISSNEPATTTTTTMIEQKSPGNQNGQRKKSSLLKRFGSLASKAFTTTTSSSTAPAASSQTNVTGDDSPAPSVYSRPKPLLASSSVVVGPTTTRANFIAIKETTGVEEEEEEEGAADRRVASIAPSARGVMQIKEDATSQSQVDENILAAAAANFTPDLKCRPAPVIQSENGKNKRKSHKLAALASADLVILPAKNSKNKTINQSGNYNHNNYNRRANNAPQQQQRQHLSRDTGKSCAIGPISSGGRRRVRDFAQADECESSSSSSSLSSLSSSSLQSSLAYSSLISTASGDDPADDSRRRRDHHHYKHHKRPTEEKAYTTRRRACSLSDELESLMSPSEDTGETPERRPATSASPPSSGGQRKGEANAPAAARPPAKAPSGADSAKSKSRASLLRNWFANSTSNSSVLSLSPALRGELPDDERHFSSLMRDKSHAIISNSKRNDALPKRNESTTRRQKNAKSSRQQLDGPASMGAIYSSVQRHATVELIDEPQPKMNICTSLLRNYVSRRHHHHHNHHHGHGHSHSHSRRHHHHHHSSHNHHKRSQRTRRHAHCVSLPPVTSKSSAPTATTSCSSCCSSLANDCKNTKSKATVWGQLIKINKSDGSQVVELQRAPSSSWGFFVARGAINSVKGIFISRMHDSATSNSLAGLLSIGDRILSIDNCPIQEPEFDLLRVNQMISKKSKISLKVKPFKG